MKWGLLALALVGAGCASSPQAGRTTRITAESREEYLKVAERRLDDWEQQANELAGPRAERLKRRIDRARVDVRAIEESPEPEWTRLRARVDEQLDQLGSQAEVIAE